MSYTKTTFRDNILTPVNKIQKETIKLNDFTPILKYLNATLDIHHNILKNDGDIGTLWNELVFDLLASIHSASSGFYRSAIVTLRSILEIGTASFFYFDHKIQFGIFQKTNAKADKYVSALINDYDFFKTKYIKCFYEDIDSIEKSPDSVSIYLTKKYGELSDVVHGRYNSLIKINSVTINYSQSDFKKYEKLLLSTLSILAVLYVLRFNDFNNTDILELANICGVVKL
ncbi:hypothetical protein [Domibacillus epiphyticus]|uniref:Uncharacterized protein n=1 Tax=Domibacillus epiphyticus TaxID=1714355 RepID=A0A1V2A7X9_9BACI|nr:hypothetical protein [Domibacillus epiphyticus]OMP67040.1 hypothetical protein BTO28_08615 [Domibacillus epiphyticus]